MKSKNNVLNYISLGFVLIGIVLCLALIQEYYGTSTSLSNAICTSSDTGINSCEKVASSNYSAVKNVPFLGDIPVATMGLTFYGLLAFLLINSIIKKGKEESVFFLSFVLVLSLLAIIIDLILFFIAAFVIKYICTLCTLTYLVTVVVLVLTIIQILPHFEKDKKQMIYKITNYALKNISLNFLNYIIIVLLFFACGMSLGYFAKDKKSLSISKEDQIKQIINEYNTAKEEKLILDGVPFEGEANAPITFVKFADFNCGHCANTSHILRKLLVEYSGMIKIYFKNFPLDGTCNRLVKRKSPNGSSCIAASAAVCAHKQNKFFKVYTALYNDSDKDVVHSPSSVMQIAKDNGLSIDAFKKCLSSDEVKNYIEKEVNEGDKLNIESTPLLFINNRRMPAGTPEPEVLKGLINHLIKTR
ncbi:MAG: thioredoxin domain-containing protein [Leptospiraceae bacterium]|nr:thioredoxin domain-containing protein [Leptospiraceae bacterium]MCP5495202.1 thioredoxin domain-containing protein [Leptospiraceae bacterium]